MQKPLRVAVLLVLVVAGCRGTASDTADTGVAGQPAESGWSLAVTPVASPAGVDSLGPTLTSSPQGAILSWIERRNSTTTLRFSERTADGWTPARTVVSGDDWFVSYADVPSVARKADGTLVANWLVTTDASIEAYNLLLSYSRDGGQTWAPPFSPHHDGTLTQHGFASFFDLPDNSLGLVWLDGRQQELDTTSPDGGSMSLRSASFDASWTQTSDAAVDVRVCECCPTTTAVTTRGVLTAFRDRSDTEVRDIRVSRLEGGTWTAGPLVHADNWTIPACPVNGPVLSADGDRVAVAWFTTTNDEGHAYASFSADAGQTWAAPIRLDEATSLGQVGIALLDDGSAVATWMEFADQRAQLRARHIEASGATSAPLRVTAEGVRPTGIPRITRVGDELIFAWTESTPPQDGATEGTVHVKTAAAWVPRATAVN